MTRILKIGLIGAGRWGPNLLGSLRRIEGVEIKHVADKSKEAVQNLLTKNLKELCLIMTPIPL